MWVDLAVYAYNTSSHESTGFSPYEMVFGRIARTPLEIDLGVPLKNPRSQSEYSESIRKHLASINESAQKNLVQARQTQKCQGLSPSNWTPLPVGQTVWLRRPKAWKFGMRWIGPYKVIACQGVNYKLQSREGKQLVVHHNNVKPCAVPFDLGEPFCPVRETGDLSLVLENSGGQVAGGQQHVDQLRLNRPAHLRQTIRPPLRFGEYVTH